MLEAAGIWEWHSATGQGLGDAGAGPGSPFPPELEVPVFSGPPTPHLARTNHVGLDEFLHPHSKKCVFQPSPAHNTASVSTARLAL